MKKLVAFLQKKLGKAYYPVRAFMLGILAVLFFYGLFYLMGITMKLISK